DISPRVMDVAKRDIIWLDEKEPVLRAIEELDEKTISVIPIFGENHQFRGMVSIHEITRFLINENRQERPEYHFYMGNFPRVLPGYFYQRGENLQFKAPIMTGAMPLDISLQRMEKLGSRKPVLVSGLREDLIKAALDQDFPAIVLTGLEQDRPIPLNLENYHGTIYISATDTAETLRLLRLSTPVMDIMDENPARFQSDITFDEAKATLLQSSIRGMPVFRGEHFDGVVTRRCFIERPRPKLILVDHNELSQSVSGADAAQILEIQDHHRLGTISTREPIFCYSRPIGSTCSIIYGHYKQHGIVPNPKIAALLLAGLTSDTVQLKSPTATDEDHQIAQELQEIANLSMEEMGKRIFSHSKNLKEKDPHKMLFEDYKEYTQGKVHFGIGQIEINDFQDLPELKKSFLHCLEEEKEKRKINWLLILFTHVIDGNSRLLVSPFSQAEEKLPYKLLEDQFYDLPGILSRKKQLLPEILRILEELEI
nr:putative manganese-dependent inorganic diphosphatase [Spirochaetaceae bacterium]